MVWGHVWWWPWLAGAALAVLAELTHEVIENSQWMIELYRQNSGTSGQYQGDSSQNITGDLISALTGWYITLGLHIAGYPWLVVIWTIISEAFLIWYMRDCGLFICIQLMCPIKVKSKCQKAKPNDKIFSLFKLGKPRVFLWPP